MLNGHFLRANKRKLNGRGPCGVGNVYDSLARSNPIPELPDNCHGTLLRGECAISPDESCDGETFRGEFSTERFPCGVENTFYQERKAEYSDDDFLGNFDPPRVPPRVAFRLTPTREAIEKEVDYLLTAKPNGPPAMIQVALNDARFKTAQRVQSTISAKRKGVNLYKGSLCVRGGAVPLNATAFISPPTVHRSGVKIICSLAAQIQWVIRAIDMPKNPYNQPI